MANAAARVAGLGLAEAVTSAVAAATATVAATTTEAGAATTVRAATIGAVARNMAGLAALRGEARVSRVKKTYHSRLLVIYLVTVAGRLAAAAASGRLGTIARDVARLATTIAGLAVLCASTRAITAWGVVRLKPSFRRQGETYSCGPQLRRGGRG